MASVVPVAVVAAAAVAGVGRCLRQLLSFSSVRKQLVLSKRQGKANFVVANRARAAATVANVLFFSLSM